MNINNKEIQEALLELPEHLQEAINEFQWAVEVPLIANRHGIQIDEEHIFQEETMKVAVGLAKASNYKENLIKKMGVSSEVAEELVYEANTNIFEKLQELAFNHNHHQEVRAELDNEGISLLNEEESASLEKSYYEEISEDDLRGIYGHRINVSSQPKENKKQELEKDLWESTSVSKGDTLVIDGDDNFMDKLKNTP
jgi:hypothetical protein